MKTLRTVHLYLGLSLAPLLLFFAVSGAWQTFELHESAKDGSYQAPRVLSALSRVHIKQGRQSKGESPSRSVVFRWLSAIAAIGISVLAILGIVMTFRMSPKKWLPAVMLSVGTILPVSILLLGRL
jgi:uncharacterized iron-regulated membrane protein